MSSSSPPPPSSCPQVTAASEKRGLEGGLSYLLPRLLGVNGSSALGRYLSLTGHPLSGRDMIASGISTHHAQGYMLKELPQRLSDISYEEDVMVEEEVADASEYYYRLDRSKNPPPLQEVFELWAENDRQRVR